MESNNFSPNILNYNKNLEKLNKNHDSYYNNSNSNFTEQNTKKNVFLYSANNIKTIYNNNKFRKRHKYKSSTRIQKIFSFNTLNLNKENKFFLNKQKSKNNSNNILNNINNNNNFNNNNNKPIIILSGMNNTSNASEQSPSTHNKSNNNNNINNNKINSIERKSFDRPFSSRHSRKFSYNNIISNLNSSNDDISFNFQIRNFIRKSTNLISTSETDNNNRNGLDSIDSFNNYNKLNKLKKYNNQHEKKYSTQLSKISEKNSHKIKKVETFDNEKLLLKNFNDIFDDDDNNQENENNDNNNNNENISPKNNHKIPPISLNINLIKKTLSFKNEIENKKIDKNLIYLRSDTGKTIGMSGYCANSNNNNSLSDTPTTINIRKAKTKKNSSDNKSFFNKKYYNHNLNDVNDFNNNNNKFIKKFLIPENIDKNIIEKKLNIINKYFLNCYSFVKTKTNKNLIVFINKYMKNENENEEKINIKKEIKEIKIKKSSKKIKEYKIYFTQKYIKKIKKFILIKSINIHLTDDILIHLRDSYFNVVISNNLTSKRHSIKSYKSNNVLNNIQFENKTTIIKNFSTKILKKATVKYNKTNIISLFNINNIRNNKINIHFFSKKNLKFINNFLFIDNKIYKEKLINSIIQKLNENYKKIHWTKTKINIKKNQRLSVNIFSNNFKSIDKNKLQTINENDNKNKINNNNIINYNNNNFYNNFYNNNNYNSNNNNNNNNNYNNFHRVSSLDSKFMSKFLMNTTKNFNKYSQFNYYINPLKSILTENFYIRQKKKKKNTKTFSHPKRKKNSRNNSVFDIFSNVDNNKKINRNYNPYKTEYNMNKYLTLLKTNEIKSQYSNNLKNDIDRIIYAIKDMNYTLFTQLYEQYINDPNIEDNLGNTLLNLAVQSNCFSITNFLLNQGADPNIANVRIIFI